jgi:translation initiation factor IF-2
MIVIGGDQSCLVTAMGHKHNLQHRKARKKARRPRSSGREIGADRHQTRLEVILKCGSAGSLQAVVEAVNKIDTGLEIVVISLGVGAINKNDLVMAATGSGLIVGYEVGVNSGLEQMLLSARIEVRLYRIIYRLLDDLRKIAESMVSEEPAEVVSGRAKVIALFKSCRHGIILGCEVSEGRLALGDEFRVITAMGEAYRGRVESLHRGDVAVPVAMISQQVGLQIRNFKKVAVGDLVEVFRSSKRLADTWSAKPGVFYL